MHAVIPEAVRQQRKRKRRSHRDNLFTLLRRKITSPKFNLCQAALIALFGYLAYLLLLYSLNRPTPEP